YIHLLSLYLFLILFLPPPSSTLFPYTTLFRSRAKRLLFRDFPVAYAVLALELYTPQTKIAQSQFNGAFLFSIVVGKSRGLSQRQDRKSTRLNSSHVKISYAVFCLKKKKKKKIR